MADETPIPKTWKDRGIDWFFSQGTTVIVLIVVAGFFGYYIYQQFPQRDAAFAKVISD